MTQPSPSTPSATFVLVHGAWAGGWSLERVADKLRARGHRVYVPTLSGLGERTHLASKDIDLTTHIDDVTNEILWKDLDSVVLVGHSYGGLVITGVAEKVADRIASIVYLDAFIPKSGQAFADLAPWLEEVPGDPVEAFPAEEGDYKDEADLTWVNSKATPQPRGTFTEKLQHTDAYQRVPRKAFIQATGWESPLFSEMADKFRADESWDVYGIRSGHDVAIDAPDELADVLEQRA